MRPVLLDTNAYTAFKLGNGSIVEVIRTSNQIGMSVIVLGELLGGFACGNKTKKNREELQEFLLSARVKIYPVSQDTSIFYSHIFAKLREKGKPIPSNDLWIAAQALEQGCVLCSFDKYFSEIEGLVVGTSVEELIY